MLTIFACPKPFQGHIATIQRNAIKSWMLLNPRPQIILCSDETGIREIVQEMGLRQVPDILRNEYGTPLLNDLFEKAQSVSDTDLVCYVNSDIILFNDFMRAVERVYRLRRSFLMVGQRWNLDVQEEIDFDLDWDRILKTEVKQRGQLDTKEAMDFFVFPNGLLGKIPPFALGRLCWDNWIVFRARCLRIAVIDVTPVVTAVHQEHDQTHYWERLESIRRGPQGRRNRELVGEQGSRFCLDDARYLLTPKGLKFVIDFPHLNRYSVTLPMFYPYLRFPAWILSKFVGLYWRIFIRHKLILAKEG